MQRRLQDPLGVRAPFYLVRTNVRFKDQANRTADRRRRPADRLRHARRVRPRARWENVSELRNPPPHCRRRAEQPAAAGSRSPVRPPSVAGTSGRAAGTSRGRSTRAAPTDFSHTRVWQESEASAPLLACRSPRQIAARTAQRRTGGDLLSQEVAPQVPSAQSGLTALFGMGRGVSHSLCATGILRDSPGGA
jgi:hypothetical protein